PLTARVFHLQVRKNQAAALLSGSEKSAAVGPIHPAVEDKQRAIAGRRAAKIQLNEVLLRHTGVVVDEPTGINPIAATDGGQEIAAAVVGRALRVNAAADSEQAKLRIRRAFELVIG